MPVKVTTAPMSGRPSLSLRCSAATSKSSRCSRIVATSASRHRREECDLARTGEHGLGLHMRAVDGGTDHLRVLEGVRIFLAARSEPTDKIADGTHVCGRLDRFLGLADALAHPG